MGPSGVIMDRTNMTFPPSEYITATCQPNMLQDKMADWVLHTELDITDISCHRSHIFYFSPL